MDRSASVTRHRVRSGGRGRKGYQQGRKDLNRDNRIDNNSSQKPLSKNDEAREDMKLPNPMASKLPTGTIDEASKSDTEPCVICASEIVHESLGPCNHRTCHVCSIRMRVLFKDKTCTLCRTSAPYVVITDNQIKRFDEYTDDYFKKMNFQSIDYNLGLRFDSAQIRDDTLWMLGYNCPEKECDVACLAWTHLHDHTRRAHNKKICDLCSKHRKVFPHEHELYSDSELTKHMRKGDYVPGAVNQSNFKGHPLCSFCGNRFYGDDELYKHLREKHERCFVCDRANPEKPPSYYIDYESLRLHLVEDHFVCKMKDCLDQKYIAFISEFELKAHMLEVHGETLSKDVRRDVRNVDLSNFSYRLPYGQDRREANNQSGQRGSRGRGRNLNADLPPPLARQPLRRDEQAFQRQLAVHSAQSVTTRNFGHQLTGESSNEIQISQYRITESSQPSERSEAIPPEEKARSLRISALQERASLLLKKDSSKLTRFHSSFTAFIHGNINARTLVDTFLLLFAETSSNALGTLFREIVDLTEDTKSAEELRTAWNNWRAINEDYPSLPTASSSSDNSALLSWAARNGNVSSSGVAIPASSVRVMKLKKLTAQSSRSSASQSRSWGSASTGPSDASRKLNSGTNDNLVAFPSLPPSSSVKNVCPARKTALKSWTSTSASTSILNHDDSSGSSDRLTSTVPIRNIACVNIGTEAFPALPNSGKLKSTAGYGKNIVKRNPGTISENVWKGNGEASSGSTAAHADVDPGIKEIVTNQKKKGKKEKKQLLMGWG